MYEVASLATARKERCPHPPREHGALELHGPQVGVELGPHGPRVCVGLRHIVVLVCDIDNLVDPKVFDDFELLLA